MDWKPKFLDRVRIKASGEREPLSVVGQCGLVIGFGSHVLKVDLDSGQGHVLALFSEVEPAARRAGEVHGAEMIDHDPTICRCGCHYPTDIFRMMHVGPCCHRCRECGERIFVHLCDEHKAHCAGKPADAGESR